MASRLQGRRTLPAYFEDKLVEHASALKVSGEQGLLVTVLFALTD
jgi:hypothetical protein